MWWAYSSEVSEESLVRELLTRMGGKLRGVMESSSTSPPRNQKFLCGSLSCRSLGSFSSQSPDRAEKGEGDAQHNCPGPIVFHPCCDPVGEDCCTPMCARGDGSLESVGASSGSHSWWVSALVANLGLEPGLRRDTEVRAERGREV